MTIKDIARLSGFSVSSVSRVLNRQPGVSREAQGAIEGIIAQYGYTPNSNARELKQLSSRQIQVVVKGRSNPFFAQLLEHIQERFYEENYETSVHHLEEGDDEFQFALQLAQEKKPLGLLFLGGDYGNFERGLPRLTLPAVLATTIFTELEGDVLSMVGINDVRAARLALERLLTLGHRRIAIIGGDVAHSFISGQRKEGCLMALRDAHIDWDEDYYETCAFSYKAAYEAMQRLLRRHADLSAVFCMSDLMAVGALRALADEGRRVPDDVSVIGFDGIDLTEFLLPRLSTVVQPLEEIAAQSVRQLSGQIKGGRAQRIIELDAHISAGESVRECVSACEQRLSNDLSKLK